MSLVVEKDGKKYYTFSNWERKKWTIPVNNSKVALCLYEPSGTKGKILKKLFPVVAKLGVVSFVLKGNYCSLYFEEKLNTLLKGLFGNDLQYSIFWGTPCIDQKITIQIFKQNRILGYCKIAKGNRVAELFKHEEQILNLLHLKRVESVPQCLFRGTICDYSVFIQSTEKEPSSIVVGKYSKYQKEFLESLKNKTEKYSDFKSTDFYMEMQKLKSSISNFDINTQKQVLSYIDEIENTYRELRVNWGIVHRDFTPWNTCLVKNKLFVFDFEYALFQAPSSIDRCHFFCQKYCFENDKECLELLKKENKIDLLTYLVSFMALYIRRGEPQDILQATNRAKLIKKIIAEKENHYGGII